MESALDKFVDELDKIMFVLMKGFVRRQMKLIAKENLTLPQFIILGYLQKEQECKMSQLADFMQVSLPTATGLVDKLVRQKLVLRLPDPKDRRIVRIRLTGQGQRLIKKIQAQRHKTIKELFSQISEFDRKEYLRILNNVKEKIYKNEA